MLEIGFGGCAKCQHCKTVCLFNNENELCLLILFCQGCFFSKASFHDKSGETEKDKEPKAAKTLHRAEETSPFTSHSDLIHC